MDRTDLPREYPEEIPNAETLEALREIEEMEADPSIGKSYTDIDEMMRELLEE